MNVFSIVIPTCNRNASLALCLDRLRPGAQTLQASNYEVIVSDDGKNNEAKALIETSYPWAKWVEGPKRGPAANRNNGAKHASGEWLVFTDDDCLPDASWLMEYKKAIDQYPHCKAFEGAILPDDWELLKKDMAECPVNTVGGCFWSANIMVASRIFMTLNGFDESFTFAAQEDTDLFHRLKKITPITFLNNAVIVHPVRVLTLKQKIRKVDAMSVAWVTWHIKNNVSLVQLIRKSLHNSLRYIASNTKKLHFKALVFNLYCLCFRFPLLPGIYNRVKVTIHGSKNN